MSSQSSVSIFKIATLGLSGVGKTSITMRRKNDMFNQNHKPTIGAAFVVIDEHISDDKIVKLRVWDTTGFERFFSMVKLNLI